jgi:hypothetical protein
MEKTYAMDPRMKKRIYAFYLAGLLNLVLALWVLFYGGELEAGTRTVMLFFFFGFAAVDFWFPMQLKKKYAEELAKFQRMEREQAARAEEAAQAKSPDTP